MMETASQIFHKKLQYLKESNNGSLSCSMPQNGSTEEKHMTSSRRVCKGCAGVNERHHKRIQGCWLAESRREEQSSMHQEGDPKGRLNYYWSTFIYQSWWTTTFDLHGWNNNTRVRFWNSSYAHSIHHFLCWPRRLKQKEWPQPQLWPPL